MFDHSLMTEGDTAVPTTNTTPMLRLFDGFRLEYGSKIITVSSNGQRLLAFLALRGDTTRADSAGTLWPDVTDAHANGSLRTTIWRLHRSGLHLVERRAQALKLAPLVRVDVRAFIEATSGIEQLAQSDDDHTQALIGGELLPGWYDDWVLFERERLRQIRLHALEALAAHLTARRKYARALEAALQCVHLEPLRESAHREVLAIHLAEQNIAEALRHYELFRQLMREEMGIEPSAQLQEMLPQIRKLSLQQALPARPR
jgi:DNA-binding SARP family transcriptional activator